MADGPYPKLKAFADVLSVYWHPRVAVQIGFGFSSGLPLLLTSSTLALWFSEARISRTSIGLLSLVGIAYSFKFAWAPLIDRLPLPWLTRMLGQRRSWMIATHAACMASLAGLAFCSPSQEPGLAALFAVLIAFSSASQDVVLDAYRIETLEDRQYGAGAAVFVYGFRVGMVAGSAGALYIADAHGWTAAYLSMAALLTLGILLTMLNPEPRREADAETSAGEERLAGRLGRRLGDNAVVRWLAGAVVAPFAEFVRRPQWPTILLFIVLYKLGDAALSTMTGPFYVEIGFSKTDIANVTKIFGLAVSLVGIFFGGLMVNAWGIMRGLLVAGILQALSNGAFVALSETGPDVSLLAVVVAVEAFTGGMGTAVFVAFLMSLCNVSYTATQFALVSSFMATARTFLAAPSGFVVDGLGGDWGTFFILSGIAAVPGLLLLRPLWRLQAATVGNGAAAAAAPRPG